MAYGPLTPFALWQVAYGQVIYHRASVANQLSAIRY
jgi:hypothetical protein